MSQNGQEMPVQNWMSNWQTVGPHPPNHPPPAPRRALVACRRCRRLRSKCVHETLTPPCLTCISAGPAEAAQCVFSGRGRQDNDREYRRRRVRFSESHPGEQARPVSASPPISTPQPPQFSTPTQLSLQDPWNLLPPYDELLSGCRVFTTSCIQLGFVPKALFLESLANDSRSVSPFLLLSMLSISARFTPSLIRRYGADGKAGEHFMLCARSMVQEEMYEPTLERTQAFFLLGIAEWGKGDRNGSSIHMGIAVRMAGMLRLHREGTYELPKNATADDVVHAEVARRTFWCIECHDNLYTGHDAPVSFSRSDISARLPCEEADFAFGRVPPERAALSGTQAAQECPELTSLPSRSIFATLIQVHDLWGQIARRASLKEREPWVEKSEYTRLTTTVKAWEENMPDRHRWSLWNFRGYKSDRIHMAYLSIVTITRLNYIVIRRIYLREIMKHSLKTPELNSKVPVGFWETVAFELFTNVKLLYEPIDTFFCLRSPEDGFPAMFIFCIYICGSCASYLWKWPQLCPSLSSEAENILMRSVEVLANLQHAWPMASKWLSALRKVAVPSRSHNKPLSAMASQERFLSAADGLLRHQNIPTTEAEDSGTEEQEHSNQVSQEAPVTDHLGLLSSAAALATRQVELDHDFSYSDQSNLFLSPVDSMGFPTDHFETDLSDFLQDHIDLGMMGGMVG